MRTLVSVVAVLLFVVLAWSDNANGQAAKKTGMVTGEVKAMKATPNGKNTIVDVLAPGEEKPRPYRVQYDPVAKAPIATVLAAVRASKVGDMVRFDWIDTGEGLAITRYEVVKRKDDK